MKKNVEESVVPSSGVIECCTTVLIYPMLMLDLFTSSLLLVKLVVVVDLVFYLFIWAVVMCYIK